MAVITYDAGFGDWRESRRNLARNPRGRNNGYANWEWQSRWGFQRGFYDPDGSYSDYRVAWFTPESQTGAVAYNGLGWDLYGNIDSSAPSADANWRALPVSAGEKLSISVSMSIDAPTTACPRIRIHDGLGSWRTGQIDGDPVAVAKEWKRVGATFDVPVSGYVVIGIHTSQVTMPKGSVLRGAQLLIERSGQIGSYFNGLFGSTQLARHRFLGGNDESPSVRETRTFGPAVIAPKLIEGYESQRRSQNVVHDILGRSDPDVTLRPASARSGRLTLLIESEEDSARAERDLAGPTVFTLIEDDRSTVGMRFVVGDGQITRQLDDATRDVWHVSFPFQEVTV